MASAGGKLPLSVKTALRNRPETTMSWIAQCPTMEVVIGEPCLSKTGQWIIWQSVELTL